MKLEDFRKLKPNEVAVVLDNGVEHVAISRYNQEGGHCGCCKNWSLDEAEVVVVRDARTGMVVWPDGYRNDIDLGECVIRLSKRFSWSYSGQEFDYERLKNDSEYWEAIGAPDCATHFSKMTNEFFQKIEDRWRKVSLTTVINNSFQHCENDVDIVHGGFIERPNC